MTRTVLTAAYYTEVVDWLTENVGPVLWSQPIIQWKGRGWHMKGHARPDSPDYYWSITIDEPRLAMLAALRWGWTVPE